MLADAGHGVTVFEKEATAGGLAKSYELEGMTYEYGPHIIANHNCGQEVIDFLLRFVEVEKTSMETCTMIDGKALRYPPHIGDIDAFPDAALVRAEIAALPAVADETDFETYLVGKVGRTLYERYFKNFTEKFWGVEAKSLSAEWAKIRHLGESLTKEVMFFNEKWCGYPKRDFNELFANILEGIDLRLGEPVIGIDAEGGALLFMQGRQEHFDLVVSTMSIDTAFDFADGTLDYAGYRIEPKIVEKEYAHPLHPVSGNVCSMVYYPQGDVPHTRTTEYKCFNNKSGTAAFAGRTLITVETPVRDREHRFYPFSDAKNEACFTRYIERASAFPRFVSLGRMGLYKYQTLDTTTAQVMRLMREIETWQTISARARQEAYVRVRG
jgi:UDP-galactopyranose mutase